MLVVTAEGEIVLLTTIVVASTAFPFRVHLYVNDHSPSVTDLLADYVEAGFPGYVAAQTLGGALSVDVINQSGKIEWSSVEFKPSSALPDRLRVFGYYVTDPLNVFCLWAERFPQRVFLRDPGDAVVFRPTLGSLSEFTG